MNLRWRLSRLVELIPRPLDFVKSIKLKLGLVVIGSGAACVAVFWQSVGHFRPETWIVAIIVATVAAQVLAHGMTRPLREMTAAALAMARGDYTRRVRATARDEVGQLALAFNQMASDLAAADRQRRELIANVSHELRTPIFALQAVLENAVDGIDADPATLSTALAQTERLGRLVTELLDLSRIEAGAVPLAKESFDVAAFMQAAIREAEINAAAVGRQVTFVASAASTLALADPHRLHQVVANLLDNAARHSPRGGVVTATARRHGVDLVLEVTDDGDGIPEADRRHVFERFTRGGSTGRRDPGGGTGLGLAIAHWVVELHGGSIDVVDIPGREPARTGRAGCRIQVRLPAALTFDRSTGSPDHHEFPTSGVPLSEQTGDQPSGATPPAGSTPPAAGPPLAVPPGYNRPGFAPGYPGIAAGRPGGPPPQGQWPIRPGDPIPPGWQPVPGRVGYIQPRLYTPPPPGVLSTHWSGPARPAPSVALSAVGLAGLVAAIALVGRPGVGWLAVGLALAVVGVLTARSARRAPAVELPPEHAPWPELSAVARAVVERASAPIEGAAPSPVATDTVASDTVAADPVVADTIAADPVAGDTIAAPEAIADEPATALAADQGAVDAKTSDTDTSDTDTTDTAPSDTDTDTIDTDTTDTDTTDTTGAAPADEPAATAGGPAGWLRKYGERTFWAAASLALLSVGVFRDAGWLIFWSTVGFLLCGAIALSGGRTVKGFAMSAVAAVAAPFAGIPWLGRGIQQAGKRRGGLRTFLAVLITIVLVVVFGALFAGADPEFNELVKKILPTLSAAEIARAIFCFLLITMVAIGVGYLASARPTFDAIAGRSTRKVRRIEWVLPLAVLNVLFVLFDVIQLTVLFNGDGALATKSKAYMKDYAHTGFWQLVWVTVLTLVVLALAFRLAPREGTADRVWFRTLLGGMSVLSMVIVASALKRVAAYEKLYGYTRLRVVVGGIELWVAFVFVLLFVAAMLIKANWLPRVIGGSLAVALFAGALVNPDLYVANRNVDRYLTGVGHHLSVAYMAELSADAAPAILRLSGKNEVCAAMILWNDELQHSEDWRSWNRSRAWARAEFTNAGLTSTQFQNCRMLNR